MLLSDLTCRLSKAFAIVSVLILAGCQFQPLYGNRTAISQSGSGLANVSVSQVNTRVAQQVRNHLIFLMHGNSSNAEKTHEARIRVSWVNKQLASIQGVRDSTSGNVTVTASYTLVDLATGKSVADGTRQSIASYDRTGQVFANERAERDAQNRAAKEAAESLRLAIAADLSKI